MTRIRTLVLGLGLLAAAAATAEDKKADAPKLEGDWVIVEGMKAGDKVDAKAKKGVLAVGADTMKLTDGTETFMFKYKIDPKATPVAIDLEITAPEAFKGAKAKGIVAIDGDNVKLAYHPMEGDRPKGFESTKANGVYSFVLKKEKKGDK